MIAGPASTFRCYGCTGATGAIPQLRPAGCEPGPSRQRVRTGSHYIGLHRLIYNLICVFPFSLNSACRAWDAEVVPFQLPFGLELVLGDVAAGSSTPSMVSKVNAWRAQHPSQGAAQSLEHTVRLATVQMKRSLVRSSLLHFLTAAQLWQSLDAANTDVERRLRALAELYDRDSDSYERTRAAFAAGRADRENEFVQVQLAFQVGARKRIPRATLPGR